MPTFPFFPNQMFARYVPASFFCQLHYNSAQSQMVLPKKFSVTWPPFIQHRISLWKLFNKQNACLETVKIWYIYRRKISP